MGTWGRRFLLVFSSNGRFFSGEIVACQELFYLLALPVSSAQSAAHFLAGFSAVIARVALSNLTEMAMRSLLQSLLRSFINGDCRDFDFVGNPYRGLIGCKGLDLYTNWWYCSLRFATQVLNFPTNCSSCNAPAETRMKVVGILPASFSCWVLTVNIVTYPRSYHLSQVTRVLFSFDFVFPTPVLSGSLIGGLQSRTKLLEKVFTIMSTFPHNKTISKTTPLRKENPLPQIQCCFPRTPRDQAFFWIHNNIAFRGRGREKNRYSYDV